MTLLQRMMFWLALRLLDLSTVEVGADTYLLNVPSTKTKILRLKSTQMTGLLNVTRGARVEDSTSPKPSQILDAHAALMAAQVPTKDRHGIDQNGRMF